MIKLDKFSSLKIAIYQSISLIIYITIVGFIIFNGNSFFGPINNFLGPVLFLTLFVSSALICAFIALASPFWIFWEKKNTKKALEIVFYETIFTFLFAIVILFLILLF